MIGNTKDTNSDLNSCFLVFVRIQGGIGNVCNQGYCGASETFPTKSVPDIWDILAMLHKNKFIELAIVSKKSKDDKFLLKSFPMGAMIQSWETFSYF